MDTSDTIPAIAIISAKCPRLNRTLCHLCIFLPKQVNSGFDQEDKSGALMKGTSQVLWWRGQVRCRKSQVNFSNTKKVCLLLWPCYAIYTWSFESDLDNLVTNNDKWHMSWYASFTSQQNIKCMVERHCKTDSCKNHSKSSSCESNVDNTTH